MHIPQKRVLKRYWRWAKQSSNNLTKCIYPFYESAQAQLFIFGAHDYSAATPSSFSFFASFLKGAWHFLRVDRCSFEMSGFGFFRLLPIE